MLTRLSTTLGHLRHQGPERPVMVCSCDLTINAHGFGEGLGSMGTQPSSVMGVNEELYMGRTDEMCKVWKLRTAGWLHGRVTQLPDGECVGLKWTDVD